MTVLYPNLCYNEVCYKGTALYLLYYSMELSVMVFIGLKDSNDNLCCMLIF